VGALIIVPAAIGRQLTHTLTAFLVTSSLASVLSVALGLVISRFYPHFTVGHGPLNLALGPAIIAVATVLFSVKPAAEEDLVARASRPCITRKMRVPRIILFLLRAVSYIRIRRFTLSPQLPRVTVDTVRPNSSLTLTSIELMN